MPPIPIYTKSPINANKASGVTPQTAAGEAEKQASPQAPPATTTAAAGTQPTRTTGYLPAQPGAVPSLPAPTGSLTSASPSAPQPGAVPPPPRAGESYQPPAAPEPTAAPQYPPPQMSIPAPAMPLHRNHGGTETATGPLAGMGNSNSSTGVTQLPLGGATGTGTYPHPGNNAISSPYAGQYQPYGGGAAAPSDDDQGEGVWDSAKKYMQVAGSKLSAAESEVWKRINSKQ